MKKVRLSLLIKLGILVVLAYITHSVPESAKSNHRDQDMMLAQLNR
jgi:hypothetical protein